MLGLKTDRERLIEVLEGENARLRAENAALQERLLALVDKAAHRAVYVKTPPEEPSVGRSMRLQDMHPAVRRGVAFTPLRTTGDAEADFKDLGD